MLQEEEEEVCAVLVASYYNYINMNSNVYRK
jgi:hypothetical protein